MDAMGGRNKALECLREVPGRVGFFWHDLVGGSHEGYHADEPQPAASLIKLPILVAAHRCLAERKARPEEEFTVTAADKLPSCGALTYLHDGIVVTFEDLCAMMVILSDNTATNMLLRRLGMDAVREEIARMGLNGTHLRRLLFDAEAAARGLENTTTAADMGKLLTMLFRGELVCATASDAMLGLLCKQRLNGKMPFALPRGTRVAHKTGEDDGITHDVGIVYGPKPFVACFLSNKTDTPAMERAIQDATLWLYQDSATGEAPA